MINIDRFDNPTLIRAMIAAFDDFNDDSTPILDYTFSATASDPIRADILDDCLTLHLDLDDELHEILMIAIFDRATNELSSLILNADSSTIIIPIP